MARRRAVDKTQTVDVAGRLPFLYTSLVPITSEHNKDLRIKTEREFGVAANANAIPITCDEFAQVVRHYPIVFTTGAKPMPMALVGLRKGVNDQIDAQGKWAPGAYVPAYLRRYPFLLVKEAEDAPRQILCADMSSTLFTQSAEGSTALLNDDGSQSEHLTAILDFATRYETSAQRTRQVMAEVAKLDLLQATTVNLSRQEKTARIEGFQVISEEKVRDLDDVTLAGLARRGLMTLFAAHHMSMANFSNMGAVA